MIFSKMQGGNWVETSIMLQMQKMCFVLYFMFYDCLFLFSYGIYNRHREVLLWPNSLYEVL